jgi:sugar (pentulose or hexulose) kinase
MTKLPVIAIYDVGKTNKKLLLFNEEYKVVYEENRQLEETKDEDGFSCEDVLSLTHWVKESLDRLLSDERFEIKAVNFAAYGASFVYLDEKKDVIPPLYNYLKPYPADLQKFFFETYGGESLVRKQTASPSLGNLNSGLQLYRLKYENPRKFAQIKYALHLPQYLNFILTQKVYSEITSIGCHTFLWDFRQNSYHEWVEREEISEKLPALLNGDQPGGFKGDKIPVGIGLHDSSAALIPYLISFNDPFILLSTGTWCISLNPFNDILLSDEELRQDCLCYLSYEGKPVKASRLFAGYEHEQQIKRLAQHFNKPMDHYSGVAFDTRMTGKLNPPDKKNIKNDGAAMIGQSFFGARNLSSFLNYEEAYHQLMADIVRQQVKSTKLLLEGGSIKRIFVDGGFSKNSIFMHLLADAFPRIEVYAAAMPAASALGAALVIHQHWNPRPLPADIIDLKLYSVPHGAAL